MIYTDMTRKALRLCCEAHAAQQDKSGLPYFLHPIHLAEQMDNESAVLAALLHDIPEDTDISIADLAEMGFPQDVLEALALLTHDKSVPYLEYVEAIKKNPIARKVKLADLRHNSDLSRLPAVTETDLQRREKYLEAAALLEDVI